MDRTLDWNFSNRDVFELKNLALRASCKVYLSIKRLLYIKAPFLIWLADFTVFHCVHNSTVFRVADPADLLPQDPLQSRTTTLGDPADRGASADAAGHRNTTRDSLVSHQLGNLNTWEELIIACGSKWKLNIKPIQQRVSSFHIATAS